MTYVPPPRPRRGQSLPARRVAGDEAGIRRNRVVSGDGVTVSTGVNGTSVSADGTAPSSSNPWFWIRLTAAGGGGLYAWQRIRGDGTASGWVDVVGTAGTVSVDP